MGQYKNNLDIVQLNCKSIRSKLGEIKILVYTSKPDIIALSETWITDHKYTPRFLNYSAEWKHRGRAGGGVGFLIRGGIQYQTVQLHPYKEGYLEYQGIMVMIKEGSDLIILNIYNANKPVTTNELKHYIEQLGRRFIIVGDLNAHSRVLDSKCVRSNIPGRSLEDILIEYNLCLINPLDFYTFVSFSNGKRSCLDLSIASSNIAADIDLDFAGDVGSDHIAVRTRVKVKPEFREVQYPERWVIDRDKLHSFSELVEESVLIRPNSTANIVEEFTSRIIRPANSTFRRSSGKKAKWKMNPWWDSACEDAVKKRKVARRRLERHPTQENVELLRAAAQAARTICQQAKKKSFQDYVQSIDYKTPVGTVWKKIKSLKSYNYVPSQPLEINGAIVIDSKEKADAYAKYLSQIARSNPQLDLSNFDTVYREACEETGSIENYNCDITLDELDYALKNSKNTSPGLDDVPCMLVKALGEKAKKELFAIIQQSFNVGNIPDSWKMGIIVPILKPGKPSKEISSYHLIALLSSWSTLCKTTERIINRRLEYIVETQNQLQESQYGFRRGYSTIDVLVSVEHRIRHSLASNMVCLIVYIDLKSAFDMVSDRGLIIKLIKMGIKGKLIRWLKEYLTNRRIQVRVDSVFSEKVNLKAGTPQGAVLSPQLFNLMISDIPKMSGIDTFIYADDITLISCDKEMSKAKRQMTEYLKTLISWAERWGLIINLDKTYLQFFTRKRVTYPIIRIKNKVIKYKKTHKLLGLHLDSPRLTWKAHIEYLSAECIKRMDLLKTISATTWGANSDTLRTFYISYIRAKIDYGAMLYATAAKTNLAKLDRIQNACMRFILGARKSTPILSLEAESYIPPLDLHRGYQMLKWYIKLHFKPVNKGITKLLRVSSKQHIEDAPVNSFLKRVQTWKGILDIESIKQIETRVYGAPPWNTLGDCIVSEYDENQIYNDDALLDYLEVTYNNFETCYTDGSKSIQCESAASAIYFPRHGVSTAWRLNYKHSVLSSELFAIKKALEVIASKKGKSYILFSDSQAALKLLVSPTGSYVNIVQDIRELLLKNNEARRVVLHWIRGHSGYRGNEVADRTANLGHTLDRSVLYNLTAEEEVAALKNSFKIYWNDHWKVTVAGTGKGKHLRSIKDNIWERIPSYKFRRKQETTIYRLRLGHIELNAQLYRFNLKDTALCGHLECNKEETVEHFLCECIAHTNQRRILQQRLADLKENTLSVKVLLGGGEMNKEKKYRILRATVDFIENTKRFKQL